MDIYDLRDKNRILTQNKFGYNKTSCEDLYDYQEMIRIKYPDEWEKTFKNKWPVRIVYYDKFNNVQIYEFYINKTANMRNVINMFKKYLDNQVTAIINCFGYDIAENIMSYMPTILDNETIKNNYLYVHIRPYEYIGSEIYNKTRIERWKVPDNMTINRVHGQIAFVGQQQISRYTILRLRAKSTPITKSF